MGLVRLSEKQKEQVAKGFDAAPELIPFIPYLLQDLWELGSSPHLIINILKSLNLPAGLKVLDLACGKGAASIQISQQLGFKCLGIDLFEPFIEEAKKKSAELELDNLCIFEVEDITDAVDKYSYFDIVILASAESLLGNLSDAVKKLRNCVHVNGYIIYDGAYLQENSTTKNPDYTILRKYNESKKILTSFGDEIIAEEIIPFEETKRINDSYTELIGRRTEELVLKYPEAEKLLRAYVRKQESECELIERNIKGVLWCLQKS